MRENLNSTWTADEMMTIAAARTLKDGNTCFVGIGIPSTAAILAKSMQAPNLFLIYESGTVNTNPQKLPLSIGDGELANYALTVVGMPEIFNYWLQSGRIDVGFLGAAQIDKFANINTTFIGQTYDSPKVRLPGAGGATEIAASCKEVAIIIRQTTRTFVKQVDFITSMGFGEGPGSRAKNRLRGGGPSRVITDLGILEPDPETLELTMTYLHPGVDINQAIENTGWELKVSPNLKTTKAPQQSELEKVRTLVSTSDK
ncbi:MAG: CoA-transferase subunit beta [Actinobacteria bacterium]|nr:CoA-transferase subunit beta [Actinomycetota bacterium]MDA2981863.1 CoA-transferase subunit beta [Actinomycetota bacterium]